MRINGRWYLCEDSALRPVISGKVQARDQSWIEVPFLVDTGADRTVLSEEVLRDLNLIPADVSEQLAGIGGKADSIVVETSLHLMRTDGGTALFKGLFGAFTDPDALDMSVLGRDITNLFALVVDRPQDAVCLLSQRHRYVIVEE